MALPWKVYTPKPRLLAASCRFPEDAAALVGLYGEGTTIKYNERVVYRETSLNIAANNHRQVAEIARGAARQHSAEAYGRVHGNS